MPLRMICLVAVTASCFIACGDGGTETARADYADSTPDFTKIRYRIRGQGLDFIRVQVDVVRDSVTHPHLSALVSALARAIDP
jgi:hypothetical protein